MKSHDDECHCCPTSLDQLAQFVPPICVIPLGAGVGVLLGQFGTWYIGMSYHPWATVFGIVECVLGCIIAWKEWKLR